MQRLIFLTLFFAQSTTTNLFSQIRGRVTYSFIIPSLTRQSITTNALLEMNDSITLFSYYKTGLTDSSITGSSSYFDPNKGAVLFASSYDGQGTQVYRNFKNKTAVFRQGRTKPLEAFIVNDDWVTIAWKITGQKKKCLGYECQQAIGTFRGREYTAWFAMQIPVPYGPWKLFGLPGLILEAYDKKKMVHLTAKTISYTKDTTAVADTLKPPAEIMVKTIREYAHYEDFYMEQVENALQKVFPKERGLTVKMDNKTKTTPEKIKLQRKYGLESKWEWEEEKTGPSGTGVKLKLD